MRPYTAARYRTATNAEKIIPIPGAIMIVRDVGTHLGASATPLDGTKQ